MIKGNNMLCKFAQKFIPRNLAPRLIAPVILLSVFLAFPLSARDTELELPLEGARIRSDGGVEAVADAEGRAVLTIPDGRRARIEVAYPGYDNAAIDISATAGGIFRVGMRLSGGESLEHAELVVEAQRPDTSETRTGRSVAISGENLSRTAEIGMIEDVMSSVKLLPGVGYTGMFNAMPSIRGGEPGDLTAVFDGFYIENPYHWGGGFSIFDPRMVQSARLSHGVFSTRYGTTISGLLEVSSKKPDPHDMELEIGLSSSGANLNLSYPLFGRGGVMIMGKLTYWDPFVAVAKQFVDLVNYVRVAPYIRSAALSANYRFTDILEGSLSGFIGADGAGAFYDNELTYDGMPMNTDLNFDWRNMQGFLLAGLTLNPRANMVLKTVLGGGFNRTKLYGYIDYDLTVSYSDDFAALFGNNFIKPFRTEDAYRIDTTMYANVTNTTANAQARIDYDWDIGKGFLFAAGVQALYAKSTIEEHDQAVFELEANRYKYLLGAPLYMGSVYVNAPYAFNSSSSNGTLFSSAYMLGEYASPRKRFGAELGLRLDHLYFMGKGFTLQTKPVLNPRLNLDWLIAQDAGIFDAVSATIGTGLFSSITDNISSIQSSDGFSDFALKQNRSWTSVAGVKVDFLNYSINLEGYYKHIFDRAYSSLESDDLSQTLGIERRFDGRARVWGIDLMLQRTSSRYWDGWISYSFNHARYRNPSSGDYTADWYYPSFHRFHNLNLVLNIKPTSRFNISTRFGFASGAPKSVVGAVTSYPVVVVNDGGTPIDIIQKYKRESAYSDAERDGFALTWDIKFSFFVHNRTGRSRMELYFAVENVLAMIQTRRTNTTFNPYTGREDQGSRSASYQLPIPMPSIGFKWSY